MKTAEIAFVLDKNSHVKEGKKYSKLPKGLESTTGYIPTMVEAMFIRCYEDVRTKINNETFDLISFHKKLVIRFNKEYTSGGKTIIVISYIEQGEESGGRCIDKFISMCADLNLHRWLGVSDDDIQVTVRLEYYKKSGRNMSAKKTRKMMNAILNAGFAFSYRRREYVKTGEGVAAPRYAD